MIIAFQTLIYFRESLLTALDWLIPIWPYYKKWTLTNKVEASDDDEEEQHVFADYDEEKGVVFFPPVYAQRYAAVADCLMDSRWAEKIQKVVDFGYNDTSFIKYLKDVPGIKCILGVDIESLPLRCSSDLLGFEDYAPRRESPLQITLYQGNAADPDYRLIGCDAVVAIEMIEHMLPHDLERLVHTVFGFIKPQIAVFTTPNGDFNVLFKALEKNGLRRLDHFFEWSREQFHDWCSNIVLRYPEYTVTCKGIGPGPAGTQRLGCCSQLALFICKDYHKQQDLDINCLALVANAPKHNDFDEMTDSWDSPDPITENNMLCAPDNIESYGDLLFTEKHSFSSVFITSPESLDNLQYKDKFSQCNIEAERGRNFLMFDDEILCYNVLIPQRKIDTKVYEFEDVASRLNCTTLQVKKFSKTTQNLMARNKLDSLVHTKEIVDEIRHMTKMLNFKKNTVNTCSTRESSHWNNINWGVNAPYWNQYYKIIKEFNYPFEVKSEECRILDLIYDEINRLIDTQDDEFAIDVNKLEIPLEHLMQVVDHLTDDMDKVKDLLEWNGYEIVDNVLIYSRLVVDNTSVGSLEEDWHDNDPLSDWDTTDVQSLSEASSMMPDIYGRSLRRALDVKVKKLRSLLTADEDITTELDKIVCRLMKLALRTTEDQEMPPPTSWMQRKLLDLLTLTEKAIERRRKHFIETYPLKAIGYDSYVKKNVLDGVTLSSIRNDDTAEKIVDKYLMLSSDSDNFVVKSEVHYTEENMSVTSIEMEPFTLEPKPIYGEVRLESIKSDSKEEIHLEITQGWIDATYNMVSPPNDSFTDSKVKSSDSNTSNDSQYRYEKNNIKCTGPNDSKEYGSDLLVHSNDKVNTTTKGSKSKGRQNKNKLNKKLSKKHSSSGELVRKYSKKLKVLEYKSYKFDKAKVQNNGKHNLQPTLSKPIPQSLIQLCSQDLRTEKSDNLFDSSLRNDGHISDNVAATKDSLFIDIVTQDLEETLALRRTIATEPDRDSDIMESEAILETVINVTKDNSFDCDRMNPFDSIDSKTIFLYDLDEPSTSKGIRHVSADAQCGTDINVCPSPSTVTSQINLSSKFETGIKISDSFTRLRFDKRSVDFGTVTEAINFNYDLSLFSSNAIKIKDSDVTFNKKVECSVMTQDDFNLDKVLITPKLNGNRDSICEQRKCSSSLSKTEFSCLKNPSDSGVSQIMSVTKYIRPKLSYCGIHVHSYRDRQVSEDVVFQGEWQRKGPTMLARKSPCPLLHSRKREVVIKNRRPVLNEKKVCLRNHQKTVVKISENNSIQKRNAKYTNPTQEVTTKDTTKKANIANSIIKNTRNNHNVSKVASKIVTSIKITRSVKNVCAIKNKPGIKRINYNNNGTKEINKMEERANKENKLHYTTQKLNKSADYPKSPIKTISPIIRSKNEDLKKDIFRYNNGKFKNLTYLVFRNEIENSRSFVSSPPNSKVFMKLDGDKNNYNSTSQNSSPCSSPNSIATVRALPMRTKISCNKSNSTSPERNNMKNVSIENISRCNNNRYMINTKSTKIMNQSSISHENKENLPETSKQYGKSNSLSKEIDKPCKVVASDRRTNVYRLEVQSDSPPSMSHRKSQRAAKSSSYSNTRVLRSKQPENHQRVASLSLCTSSSFKCKSPVRTDNNNTCCDNDRSYTFPEVNHLTRSSTPILDEIVQMENEHIHYTKSNIKRSTSKINAAMQQLIEERLNFITRIQDNTDSDSETVILSRDNQEDSINDDLSQVSVKTVVTNANACNITGRDIENALLSYSFDSNIDSLDTLDSTHSKIPDVETDIFSFKSIKSEIGHLDNLEGLKELDNTLLPQESSNTKTVRDLFERKDQPLSKNPAGILAVQVFSGYSMDGDPIVGDQPEYTGLVDPETGNLTLEVVRQTTSEELFISGRSSDTYESCDVDDDAYVPNWLFRIISQQQSEELPDEEQEAEDSVDEPEYDVNGNMMEQNGLGAGVGAGDGHGMHSDQSQDSSGRGTSISSSEVSSGPQSEAILIDPSAFLGPAHIEVPMNGPNMPVETSDASFRTVETMETEHEPHFNPESRRRRYNRLAVASDADADVSSLETDVADSDD